MSQNSMTKKDYIMEHLIWGLLVFVWFKMFLFRCIPHCTYTESLIGFVLISLFVIAIGILTSFNRNRNYKNLAGNIVLSWGVFVCISYSDIYKKRITYTLIVMVIVSLLLSAAVLLRRIRKKNRYRKIVIQRMGQVATLWKKNATIASLFIVIPLAFSSMLYGTVLNSKFEVAKVYGEEHSLKANIKIISDIEPARWKALNLQEKLLVAQKIVNVEARYYGLTHEILVGVADLSAGTLACYKDSTHQIIIALDYIENSYSYYVLRSLLHEVHHAYQYNQVELYKNVDKQYQNLSIFYEASIYMSEFKEYKDGAEDFDAYYTQLSEINAREAGEIEPLEYIEAINEYLGIEVDMSKFSCLQEYVDYLLKNENKPS